VRARWGDAGVGAGRGAPFPGGAGLRPESVGGAAFVLVEGAERRSLGGALAWALRFQAGALHLLVDANGDVLARRAEPFRLPVTVWAVTPSGIVEIEGRGFFPPPPLAAEDARWAEVLRAVGAEPVVEFGVLSGEVLGLEVARVVDGRLEAGVGVRDRTFHRDLEPERPVEEVLAEVVALVRRWRRAGAAIHLANTLAGERWLRHVLVARPDVVGAAWLAPMPPAVPRGDLRLPSAAMMAGVDREGAPVVVAASTGVDLDLVPAAADAHRAAGLPARLILAVPEGDDHPRTRQLAALLNEPAQVVTVPAGWKALTDTL